MSRRLGWIGIGVLAAGVLTALVVRLAAPASLYRTEFFADGAVLTLVVALLLAAIFLVAGALLRWQQNVTGRALASQANSLEDERRRFIRRLDHELKNPLTAMQVQLDNLEEDKQLSSPTLVELRSQADRLSQLTRGLRRLADLETRPLELERVEVGELMDEVVDLLQAPKRIELDIQRLPWPIPSIEGDRELLLIAFRNLVENALIYSSDAVQVRARDTSRHLVVEVVDTGRGIPADEIPLVTEELYRGSNVREVAGSGLGLAITQRIIARHGGHLELRSRPEQGTIATVQLPYEQARS